MSSSVPAPSDYVVSKRMLTRFVTSYKHDFTHWHFIIPTIYGPGENPKRLIPYTISSIRNNIPLHFTAGDQVRQYIHVSEVPKLIELAYHKQLDSGIYNIKGPETMTVHELVTNIHKALGKEVPSDSFGTTERNDTKMKYLALDGNKLKTYTGFEGKLTIDDVIKTYL